MYKTIKFYEVGKLLSVLLEKIAASSAIFMTFRFNSLVHWIDIVSRDVPFKLVEEDFSFFSSFFSFFFFFFFFYSRFIVALTRFSNAAYRSTT